MATTTKDLELHSPQKVENALVEERKRRKIELKGISQAEGIPAISLKRFFEGEEGKKEVAKQWDLACRNVGFLTIVDHGVPVEVIEELWRETTEYFDRPLDEKKATPMSKDYPYGYQGIGGENLQASLDKESTNPGDVKEMFNVCFGTKNKDPDLPTPQFPPDSPSMQAAWRKYSDALDELSQTLYRVCALALGLPELWFDEKLTRNRNVIRAIHYPEQTTQPLPGQVRASMHTDYGALTILRVGGEDQRGLQVMGCTGDWVDVDPTGIDAFIINLGDLMAKWTNDRWMSTPHRVINPPNEASAKARRLSVAYFCNINMDTVVECIPTCKGETGAKYEAMTAGEHLMKKHQQTVAGKLCYEAAV